MKTRSAATSAPSPLPPVRPTTTTTIPKPHMAARTESGRKARPRTGHRPAAEATPTKAGKGLTNLASTAAKAKAARATAARAKAARAKAARAKAAGAKAVRAKAARAKAARAKAARAKAVRVKVARVKVARAKVARVARIKRHPVRSGCL